MAITNAKKETILVALGGNALIQKQQTGTAQEQLDNLKAPCQVLAKLYRKYNIVITHGNGPQVGNLLLQQESCEEVPKMPLEIIGAMTQGQIGYMIESTLDTQLMESGINDPLIVTLITYVVVDEEDPSFQNPTKPIGPTYTEGKAMSLPFPTRKTLKGYRRVVASPVPQAIIAKNEIRRLVDLGFIVVCCGGGGIPVIRKGRSYCGVDAVIDKDLASAKMAEEVKANVFIVATDVDGVYLNYGEPSQKLLRTLKMGDAQRYLKEGYFPAGSMGPKIEAALQYMEGGGKRAIITSIGNIEAALDGKAGTQLEHN
jgi:carbamate kinase